MSNIQKKPYRLKGSGKRSPYKTEDILQELITLKIKEHYTNMSLLEHIQNKYGFSKTWAYNWLNAVSTEIREIQEKNVENLLLEQQVKLLNEIEIMKKEKENKKTILEYIKEFNRISGLYQERIQITGDITITAQFSNGSDTSQSVQAAPDSTTDYIIVD